MPFGGADFAPSRTPEASNALQATARTIVNTAARKTKNLREFSAAIKEQFEAANGVGWHVLAGPDFAVDLRYRIGACVLLSSQKSKLKVIIYRTQPTLTAPIKPLYDLTSEPVADVSQLKNRKSATGGKIVWYSSDMEDAMKAKLITYTQALLTKLKADTSATLSVDTRLAQALKVQLSYEHGNTWHVIASAFARNDLCCLPYCQPNTFADYSVDNVRVVLYRHNGADIDTRIDMTLFAYRALLTVSAICFVVYSYFNDKTTDLHTTCGAKRDGDDAGALPEGCSAEDVAAALAHYQFKQAAFIGLFAFTVAASVIRLYRRALRMQLKYG